MERVGIYSVFMTRVFFKSAMPAVVALGMVSCSTVNNTLDSAMSLFKSKAAADEAGPAVEGSGSVTRANYNTAVMMLDLNGARKKVVIELRPDLAPKTVANFKKLVNVGFYNNLAWHRAIRGYIVQTGDPASKGDDRRNEWGLTDVGYRIVPEIKGLHNRGALAMARPGALESVEQESSGSQFYVTLRKAAKLDGGYTVFGYVTQGIEALEAVGNASVDTNDCPTKRYEIKSIRLVPKDSPELAEEPRKFRKTKPEHEKTGGDRFFERFW